MSDLTDTPETETMAIRAALNRWVGPVQRLDDEGKQRENAERETMLQALFRLYAVSRSALPPRMTRTVQNQDVERILSCFRRLSLISGATPAKVADYCERASSWDDNIIAHRADPFLVRYALTYHDVSTEDWFADKDMDRLRFACERADQAGIHAWFAPLVARKEALPKDACPFLRLVLLRLWNRRMGDLETLAYEQAVLEVRQYEAIGWENTRMFCALLRRIGGGNFPAFGAYLNSDDITEATALHEALGDAAQAAHFKSLAKIHDPQLVGQLEKAVLSSAAHAEEQARLAARPAGAAVPVAPAPRAATRMNRFFRTSS